MPHVGRNPCERIVNDAAARPTPAAHLRARASPPALPCTVCLAPPHPGVHDLFTSISVAIPVACLAFRT